MVLLFVNATLIMLSALGLWTKLLSSHPCRYFLLRRANRPQVLQNIIDMRKRLKGVPTSGTVSIAVTDIEDFSGGHWPSNLK